ncbi:hypothetical protein EV669_1013 [Gulbenkiania mobilis]|uniref:Uncharacterized protein n=2 Tax=Gulbenkiania mobilis TaxID=397457 RepID=A0ABY2CZM0_GULMO|nr:hypothetical protein EV669_1013 [Gulbenkiania mobilis]
MCFYPEHTRKTMRPHPRNARIKGDPFLPGRFIFGDSLDDKGLEPCEYVIHTEAPAFICRLVGNDDTPFVGRDAESFASAMLFDEAENITLYVCNAGFRLFDFNFIDEVPTAGALQQICDEAMQAYQRLQEAYAERESGYRNREMRTGPTEPLLPAERTRHIQSLKDKARQALEQPWMKMQLAADVQMALAGGDQAVFTEAQLALMDTPDARQLLIGTARGSIAQPEVMRKDGSIVSFELWALPFAFTRSQGGVWWHFPMLEKLEVPLADALEVPEKSILWISPTLFTLEMLHDRACQNLIHLAPVMDAGCDFAPFDPDASRATYEAARQTREPQRVLAWIPFLIERGAVPADRVRTHARRALESAMPVVQEAIAREMEYEEAELFAPQPWWDALENTVKAWNRKRLATSMALLAATAGTLSGLKAEVEYQPEQQAYDLRLHPENQPTLEVRVNWVVQPDVAPDREAAYADLAACLAEAGIPLSERIGRIH